MTTEFFMAMIPPKTTSQQKQVTVVKNKPVFKRAARIENCSGEIDGPPWATCAGEDVCTACQVGCEMVFPNHR
ncbi:hypothetical protein P7H17_24405 [Paenibacillus larvae]|nr:hypothetical protein [Paenibacillus larvae]MDT2288568.1 hypothetical protein [Paenibacillus larvae]